MLQSPRHWGGPWSFEANSPKGFWGEVVGIYGFWGAKATIQGRAALAPDLFQSEFS
jgi:hypothetical protein